MKISKNSLRRIIREEKQKLEQYDFGSNTERQQALKELNGPAVVPRTMDDVSSSPPTIESSADKLISALDYWWDAFEKFEDPRAMDIDELLQQLYERLTAVQQGRD